MEIQKLYDLPFDVETIYDAWIFSEALISPATRLDISPIEGGELVIWIEAPNKVSCMRGVFKEIIRNKKLVYSWEWNNDGEETEVSVEFSPNEKGTTLNISHTGWQKEESRKMHDLGWDSYIKGLTSYLNTRN